MSFKHAELRGVHMCHGRLVTHSNLCLLSIDKSQTSNGQQQAESCVGVQLGMPEIMAMCSSPDHCGICVQNSAKKSLRAEFFGSVAAEEGSGSLWVLIECTNFP